MRTDGQPPDGLCSKLVAGCWAFLASVFHCSNPRPFSGVSHKVSAHVCCHPLPPSPAVPFQLPFPAVSDVRSGVPFSTRGGVRGMMVFPLMELCPSTPAPSNCLSQGGGYMSKSDTFLRVTAEWSWVRAVKPETEKAQPPTPSIEHRPSGCWPSVLLLPGCRMLARLLHCTEHLTPRRREAHT